MHYFQKPRPNASSRAVRLGSQPAPRKISSRVGKAILTAFLFLGLLAPGYAKDDYERNVKNLAAGTPDGEIMASLHALEAAGLAAFPILIAHFSDRDAAEPGRFQRAIIEIAPDGSKRPHLPTIGEVCFDILQMQIEGSWPKGFREYHVLTPGNTKQWLDARPGFTLAQLRRASLEESLRRAEADLAKNRSDDLLKKTVTFLHEELESIKQ